MDDETRSFFDDLKRVHLKVKADRDRLAARADELERERDAAICVAFHAPQFVGMETSEVAQRLGGAMRQWIDDDETRRYVADVVTAVRRAAGLVADPEPAVAAQDRPGATPRAGEVPETIRPS